MVAKVAKETGVATQMGNHGRSGEGHRQTVEWIQDGAIGQVREVHAWASAGNFAAGPRPPEGDAARAAGPELGPVARPARGAAVPSGLRALQLARLVGVRRRRHARRRTAPPRPRIRRAAASTRRRRSRRPAPGIDEEVCSDRRPRDVPLRARAATKGPVTACWYDGGLRPPTPAGIDPDDPKQRMGEGPNGIFFVGEKGILTCGGWSGMPRLLPLELHRDYKRPPKTLPRVSRPPRRLAAGLQGRHAARAATSTTRRA